MAEDGHAISFIKYKNIVRDSQNFNQATDAHAPAQVLFRQQAIEHVSTRQYGNIVLARSFNHNMLTGLFVVIAVAIIAFFTFFSTTRKAQCQGVLRPTAGVIRLVPGQSGVIAKTQVTEGQLVHAGDVLFVLSSERSSVAADSTQNTISALMRSRRDSFNSELKQSRLQAGQRILASQRRAADLAADIDRIGEQMDLQRGRVELSEQNHKRFSDLLASNYISRAQLQEKQAELLDQRQRLAELRRLRAASQRDLATAETDLLDLQVQARRDAGALQRNVTAIEQDLTENEARREILVRASQDGMVATITTNTGQTVAANTVLAVLLPAGAELEAEIYVPSRSVGFVKPGMTVLLRYQAYPYQKFGQHTARVREVAHSALNPQDLSLPGATSGNASEPLYRIRLKLDAQTVLAYGKAMPLKSGMLIDASILLDQRRLYEWVLEPLFSVSGRI